MLRSFLLVPALAIGPVIHAQIQSVATHGGLDYEPFFTASNGKLFYKAFDGPTGWELHVSDGTAAGTHLIKDINPGAASSLFQAWTVDVDGTVYFAATDGVNGTELWKSDGTEAGTVLVKDINPGPDDSNPRFTLSYQGGLLFVANNAISSGLWKSDGTEGGTMEVHPDFSAYASYPVIMNDIAYFNAYSNSIGEYTLWKTNGTSLLTEAVLSPWSGGPPSAHQLTATDDLVYFVTSTVDLGSELWRSDGYGWATAAVDIRPGPSGSSPSNITTIGDTAYFRANDGVNGPGLYRFRPGHQAEFISSVSPMHDGTWRNPYMVAINDVLYYVGYDPATGVELFKSDGTAAGTVLVKDINPGLESGLSELSILCAVGDTLYFTGYTAATGHELWVSDLTEAGTIRVQDRNPGSTSFQPRYLTKAGDDLFMGASLYQLDGELFKLGMNWVTSAPTEGELATLAIRPCPAHGDFQLSDVPPTAMLVMYDAFGRSVPITIARNEGAVSISTTAPAGSYVVVVIDRDGARRTARVVLE